MIRTVPRLLVMAAVLAPGIAAAGPTPGQTWEKMGADARRAGEA